MVKIDTDIYSGVEKTSLDLNIPERQAMEGYVPTFLVEHRTIISIMSNPTISFNERCNTVSKTVYFMVSLITDVEVREKLWQWFDDELKIRLEKEPDADQNRKIQIEYDISCILEGKIMDFVGKHITKPVEIGTE